MVLMAVWVAACDGTGSPLPLVGTLERDRLELIAEAQERIVEISVTEGAAVSADQPLARLETALYEARVAEATADVQRAEQRLAELVRGPRSERISQARARLRGAREHLSIQEREYERIQQLREDNLASAADVDRLRDKLEMAQADADEAGAGLEELLQGTTAEELGQAEAELERARAILRGAKLTLSRLEIRAPRDGIIEAIPYEIGERPPAGAPVIVMLAAGTPYARIYVPEPLRARISPGMRAEIHVDGVASPLAGEVRYIAREASFTPYFALTQRDRSRLAFVAEVTVTDERARDLPSGVPVEVGFPGLR
jgi:HlyD family secretion protein